MKMLVKSLQGGVQGVHARGQGVRRIRSGTRSLALGGRSVLRRRARAKRKPGQYRGSPARGRRRAASPSFDARDPHDRSSFSAEIVKWPIFFLLARSGSETMISAAFTRSASIVLRERRSHFHLCGLFPVGRELPRKILRIQHPPEGGRRILIFRRGFAPSTAEQEACLTWVLRLFLRPSGPDPVLSLGPANRESMRPRERCVARSLAPGGSCCARGGRAGWSPSVGFSI